MTKNTMRLISDPETTQYHDPEANLYQYRSRDPIISSMAPNATAEQTVILSPMFRRFGPQPSIETRLKEQFKPTIGDRSVLRPDKFRDALDNTCSALINQMKSEKKAETKSALSNLISLLEENTALQSLLDANINPTQKS